MKSKLKKLGRWSALPAIALLAALMLYNGILNRPVFLRSDLCHFLAEQYAAGLCGHRHLYLQDRRRH